MTTDEVVMYLNRIRNETQKRVAQHRDPDDPNKRLQTERYAHYRRRIEALDIAIVYLSLKN